MFNCNIPYFAKYFAKYSKPPPIDFLLNFYYDFTS